MGSLKRGKGQGLWVWEWEPVGIPRGRLVLCTWVPGEAVETLGSPQVGVQLPGPPGRLWGLDTQVSHGCPQHHVPGGFSASGAADAAAWPRLPAG